LVSREGWISCLHHMPVKEVVTDGHLEIAALMSKYLCIRLFNPLSCNVPALYLFVLLV
jgi:hypothetical protein